MTKQRRQRRTKAEMISQTLKVTNIGGNTIGTDLSGNTIIKTTPTTAPPYEPDDKADKDK